MSVKNKDRLLKVMKSELCNRCGTCVGLSGGKIKFSDKEKKYRPVLTEELTDEEGDRLWKGCAGKEFSFPEYRKYFYPDTPQFHTYTGPFRKMWIGHVTDEAIRRQSASGGILTSVLLFLLEKKHIRGAIVTRMSRKIPWLTETCIATTATEIQEAAQSKYIITSVNEVLSISKDFKGELAYIGLPGQVQSIRKLQRENDPAVANIKYIFGPFYGNTLYFSSIKSFLKSHKEKDHTQIKKLWFRYGEWPGKMRIEMKSGNILEQNKFHANYLIPFHILKNSLYCTDFSNEFTDISGGDAWAPVYEEKGKGFSLVISRTEKGEIILNEMIKENRITLSETTLDEAITMHSHGYDFKKRGAFIRIKFRKILGKPIPDYGYRLSKFPVTRYAMELIISGLFVIMGTKMAHWMVERFSPGLIGIIFQKSRGIWKNSTKKIKRKNL